MIINGDLDLNFSSIKSLGKIKQVNGDLDLSHSKIVDLGDLEIVNGFFYLVNPEIKSLGKLKIVKKVLDLTYCYKLEDLGELKEVGMIAMLRNTKITLSYIKNINHFFLKTKIFYLNLKMKIFKGIKI